MYSRKLSSMVLGVFASSRLAGRGGAPMPPLPPKPIPSDPGSGGWAALACGGAAVRGGAPMPPLPPPPNPSSGPGSTC
jgi:hypothetical protein